MNSHRIASTKIKSMPHTTNGYKICHCPKNKLISTKKTKHVTVGADATV